MSRDRPRERTLYDYEPHLLMVMLLGIVLTQLGQFFYPEIHPVPQWVTTALLLAWIVFFLTWAARGGVPPHFGGGYR